jgi:heme/copper-type cytochrome/quinol oxidase subunit 2
MKPGTLSKPPLILSVMMGVVVLILWRFFSLRESEVGWSPTLLDTPIKVRVVGHDFFWRFRFPGPDQLFDTDDDATVEKELHLPADRDVVFLVSSDDYVYTMSIPDLGIRQIAVPELIFPLEFRVAEERSFNITADPLCGVRWLHDDYMGRVTVQSQPAFDSWYGAIQ